ncbi:hypothetical protein D187_005993 [Cystobacter fuscus DSM 2262]|uniref:Uncharacterized protein n=1 Tax=Cystobacter fuscus (strain ATCC 25194 / DSM 2262 / NBRC 100088 / M29) TaxID=1242864 RepID=S9PGX6_CYSF2|nr:hypothetical protein [Cystobacter fuscus]EPX63585.1 hypothetical protein D187_005993 [Cystobacter fuscus DSM 2262]
MRFYRDRFAFVALVTFLLVGANVPAAPPRPPGPMNPESIVQPFIITFDRHEVQVIALLANHPVYDAIEVMVTRRTGRPPLLRAIITQLDGVQIDFINDEEMARERAAVLTNRRTLYRPMQYEEGERNGLPTMRLRFTSHEGERILLSFEAFSPPTPEQGGFINPGNHSEDSSLPMMWANTSAFAHPSSQVTVDGISYQLRPAPQPGALLFIYSEDFLIGVIREGELGLWLAWAPKRVAVGERWLYWDNLRNLHQYEIIGMEGDVLTLHKTTTSSFLAEEILTVQRVEGKFLLRSVRNTGRLGRRQDVPPASQGFTLRMSTEEGFSLSTDEHENLVTGSASWKVSGNTTTRMLHPMDPPWTQSRTVRASVTRYGPWHRTENTVGEH